MNWSDITRLRIGKGFDVHALVTGRPLIIGGVSIPFEKGLEGHSDADVLMHAICDALLGAANLGDIGVHFPPEEAIHQNKDSALFLQSIARSLEEANFEIINIDSTIVAQAPKMRAHISSMIGNIATALSISREQISVKATTTEQLGFAGRGEGIAADAVALIYLKT